MQIIPAIDIIGGKCVRLTQGDYADVKAYYDDPLDVAYLFEDHGLKRLHLVDLDGAKEKRIINHKVLEKIAGKTKLIIDVGGGIQTDKDLEIVFECGAQMATAGSIAVKDKDMVMGWLKKFGAEKIILGADTKDKMIAVSGWQEKSSVHLFDLMETYLAEGMKYCISTDVAKDGMLQGPSFDLYKEMKDRFPEMNIIASGGVSSLKDLEQLKEDGLFGVIIGKAIYEGRISMKELAEFV